MRLCVADIVLCLGTPERSILSGWGGGGGGGGGVLAGLQNYLL